jgi:hypothetical protein
MPWVSPGNHLRLIKLFVEPEKGTGLAPPDAYR